MQRLQCVGGADRVKNNYFGQVAKWPNTWLAIGIFEKLHMHFPLQIAITDNYVIILKTCSHFVTDFCMILTIHIATCISLMVSQ